MTPLYGELIGIDFHVEDMDVYNWYKMIKKTENRIDRSNALCSKLFEMGYFEWYNKCYDINKKAGDILPFLYKRLAGHAVWLRREHIKQQCEIVKKINEV